MADLIKINYAVRDNPSMIFNILITRDAKCKDFLQLISEKNKKRFVSIYFQQSEIDFEDFIFDYLESDPKYVFIVSTDNTASKKEENDSFGKISNETGSITKEKYNKQIILTFYFTGVNKEMLLKGINVELNTEMNPDQCKEQLLNYVGKYIDITDKQLLVFLSGGIYFTSGTLGDLYLNDKMNFKKVIYGVLTRKISEEILNDDKIPFYSPLKYYKGKDTDENEENQISSDPTEKVININNENQRLIISPLCDSTEKGLVDMACLISYLLNGELNSDIFYRASSSVINFPPYIISMQLFLNIFRPVVKDIIVVCSTLFTFYKEILPFNCSDNQVYEYCLQLSNLIFNINEIPESLPIEQIKLDKNNELTYFLFTLNNVDDSSILLWKGDVDDDFEKNEFKQITKKDLENAFDINLPFTPHSPYSVMLKFTCSIIKGKSNNNFFDFRKFDVYNIFDGSKKNYDFDLYAKSNFDVDPFDFSNLIEPNEIKQIIMVNFDKSKSMLNILSDDADSEHVAIFASQILTILSNRMYGYRIPCAKGLVTFDSNISFNCPITIFSSDFENECLIDFSIDESKKMLYDSILFSCEEIFKFRKNILGNEIYQNAKSRIIVITDGKDIGSTIKIDDLIKILLKNNVIVDSIIINTKRNNDPNQMLLAISRITGGYSFLLDHSQIINLLEKNSFLNLDERAMNLKPLIKGNRKSRLSLIKPEEITKDFINKVIENAKFDAEIKINELFRPISNVKLSTPQEICSKLKDSNMPNSRYKRILKELRKLINISNPDHDFYDPDIEFYVYQNNIDKLKVFLRLPYDISSPYSGKWWYLFVSFPDLYPTQPAIFRFVSVPFHINIASDGNICVVEKINQQSKDIYDIIAEIKEILLLSSSDLPVNYNCFLIYKTNIDKYNELAKESTEKNAKDDYHDFLIHE